MTAPRPWLSCGATVRTRRPMHRAQLCRTRRADREPQSVPRETRPLTRSRRESVAERAADSDNWVEEYTAVVALPAAPSLIGTPTPVLPPARRTPTETPRSEDPPATHEARTSLTRNARNVSHSSGETPNNVTSDTDPPARHPPNLRHPAHRGVPAPAPHRARVTCHTS